MTPRRAGISFDDVVQMACTFPDVEDTTSYRTRAIKVRGKNIARIWEDGHTTVLRAPIVARNHLMATHPDVFFLTDHYRDYPYVLVHLQRTTRTQHAPLLEDAWRSLAPTRVVAADVPREDARHPSLIAASRMDRGGVPPCIVPPRAT